MKYRYFTAVDFANDSFFIRWVKDPDEESEWFWSSFAKENAASREEIEKAREIILLLDSRPAKLEHEELGSMRNGLLLALRADKEERPDKRLSQSRLVLREPAIWLKIAAAIIILPLVAFGLSFLLSTPMTPLASIQGHKPDNVEERVNPSGQKSVLFLSDGTKVWLNAASRITYVKDFKVCETRDVYLEGEAFFDVAHNKEKPFVVHTSSIKIKVLGTSFNVKSYAEEKTIETTLVQGKVRIESSEAGRAAGGDIELKPNQRAVFDKELKVMSVKEVVASNSALWKQSRLVFDAESIDNVLLQLERWFNVTIHAKNRGNLNCKLTASIEKESLEEVLKLVEESHDIHYRIVGREVFLEGTFCSGAR